MGDFRTNQRVAIVLYKFGSGLQKLGRLNWNSWKRGNKKVKTRRRSFRNAAVCSFQFDIVIRRNANLTMSTEYTFIIA